MVTQPKWSLPNRPAARATFRSRAQTCNWQQASLFTGFFFAPSEQVPEATRYAAVMVISEADDEGSNALDRSSFAPRLSERLT
jgi:hypothetical protein